MECGLVQIGNQQMQLGIAGMRAVLDASLEEGVRAVWLIDPTRYPTVADCATTLGLTTQSFDGLKNLYAHYTPSLREWGPRLLPAGDTAVDPVLRQAVETLSATLLVTADDLDDVTEHLVRLVKLRHPDGSRLLFRFQDPLVMAQLLPMLARAQQCELLGPLQGWWVVDECARLVSVKRPAGASGKGPLVLNRSQLDALDERLRPATVITQVNEVESTLLAGLDRCAQWCEVRARLERASSHGLASPQDLSLFVILSFQLPDDFDRVGPVARALERAKENSIGFSTAVEQVPVEEWREWDEVLDER